MKTLLIVLVVLVLLVSYGAAAPKVEAPRPTLDEQCYGTLLDDPPTQQTTLGLVYSGKAGPAQYADTGSEKLANLPPTTAPAALPKPVELDPENWEFSLLQTTPGTGGCASYRFAKLKGTLYAAWLGVGLIFDSGTNLLLGASTNLPLTSRLDTRGGFGALFDLSGDVELRAYVRVPISLNF